MSLSIQIVKQANGLYRWTATSSNNIQDRDGETLSLKALQADVARTKMFGDDDGKLYFYHIPYPIGGPPDYRTLVGGMLVESGEFLDHPVAKTIAEHILTNPDGLDGSGWGTSIGFMGVADFSGVYHSALINERSVLPLSKAANAYTSFGARKKNMLTADQQKALDMVLGDAAMVGIVKTWISAQDQSKMADQEGLTRKMAVGTAQVQAPVFKKAGNYEATPQVAAGFAAPQTKAEGDDVTAAAVAEANLNVAQQALGAAADAVAGLGASEVAEPAAVVTPDTAVAMAADPAVTTPAPATPAPATPDQPKPDAAAKGMSDEDMAGIAKWVQETVNKAVGDAMTAMKAEMQGTEQKMRKDFSQQKQVELLNELPRTAYERLKALGINASNGIEKGAVGFVEKGNNLPAAPDSQAGMKAVLGFEE